MESSLKILKKDKRFAALIARHGVPDLKRGNNLFQALARAIVYQQLSGKAASTIYARFVALFNDAKLSVSKHKFPKPRL